MNVQALLASAECASVEQFMRRCERETVFSATCSPIGRCDYCSRRAIPGQYKCSNCLEPIEAPRA